VITVKPKPIIRFEELKSKIEAATTIEELEAIKPEITSAYAAGEITHTHLAELGFLIGKRMEELKPLSLLYYSYVSEI